MGEPREIRASARERPLRLRLLVAAACVLTAGLFAPLCWHIAHSYRVCRDITESYVNGEAVRDGVYHANEQLVFAARSAALGGPAVAGRDTTARRLRALLADARDLQSACGRHCWLTRADSLQATWRMVEEAAFALADAGHRDAALALITSPAYGTLHDAFDAALERFARDFQLRVRDAIVAERREEMAYVGVSGTIFVASVAMWILLVRAHERWRRGMLREAAQRAAAERQLAASLRRFRRLFHHAHDAIYLVAARDGSILDANSTACAQTGYSRRQLRARRFADLDADPAADGAWHDVRRRSGVVERCHRRRDGGEFPVEVGVTLIDETAGPVQLCVVRDVTERKNFERRLGQAQRMECVGRLAAGIAHDFGNILLAVSGYATVGRRQAGDEGPLAEILARIEDAVAEATGVTRSLLHFAHPAASRAEPVELRAQVRRNLALVEAALPRSVELDAGGVDGPSLWVDVDPQRLQQALLNLCLNARDAMPAGGRLSVAVTEDGACARVAVSDTGAGIPHAVLPRLGEPFFTTRTEDGGCGLGLFNVRTIMEECGGRLEIAAPSGAGAVFRLVLPLREAPDGAGPAADDPVEACDGTVLLAVADDLVRGLAVASLQSRGLEVRAARDAGEFARLRHDGARADAVVVDSDLPGGGAAACLACLGTDPIPAVLVLGDPRTPPASAAAVLAKPFTMRELCDAVLASVRGAACREGRA